MSQRARYRTATMLCVVAAAAVPAGIATFVSPAIGKADTCADAAGPLPLDAAPCSDVLGQEGRWLTAITDGDVATVESILAPAFKHITSEGQLLDRAQEIAGTGPQSFVMDPTEQTVDIAGDTAVVHGVNTVTQDGTVLERKRFTDVFVLQDGTWLALSAQETAV